MAEEALFQQKSLSDVQAELERAHTDLRLTKEARKADQILWKIDRARGTYVFIGERFHNILADFSIKEETRSCRTKMFKQ